MSQDSKHAAPLSPIKQALLTIETLQAKLAVLEQSRVEPIAIIGMGCRFPGGIKTPEAFWQLLSEGRDVFREVPAERSNLRGLYDPDPDAPGKMYMRYGGFLEDFDRFDAPFFRVSPREAQQMDPQQRLLLEVSWEALEHAGQAPDALAGSQTGVFVGVLSTDYAHLPGNLAERVDGHYYPGVNSSFLAGRLSYFLGLHGQSLVVDTACSSSLAAVHLACQSLRGGESNMAVAGGVNLILSPEISVFLCRAGVISPTGTCRAFDADADGIVRGEGCGMVVLKRLTDALAAGDSIHAVILGTAVNHDGASGGLTVPNPRAQSLLYRTALHNAGVAPDEVSYIEAHGTGTKLGDPVELQGLSQVFGNSRSQPLYVGSVKTNIGHTDSAAGIAGLIKTVLILKHGSIPPTVHFRSPNPAFAWDRSSLEVVRQQTPLPARDARHIAGVSAFGLSGMNAHVVLQAAPRPAVPAANARIERPLHVMALSANTNAALDALISEYKTFLSRRPSLELADVCYTANTGRVHFPRRLAVVATSLSDLQDQLHLHEKDTRQSPEQSPAKAPRVVFLFTGQGAQYVGMGRHLYATQPTFRRELDRCDAILRSHLPQSLLDVMYPQAEGLSDLHETIYAQPALFALEYALATLWQSWGVTPDAVMGHSVGEYVAACVAGVMSLEEGLRLIAERGRLMQMLPQDGAMVSVFATIDEVLEAMRPYEQDVAIAAVNGPNHIVISGRRELVPQLAASLSKKGARSQTLQVSHAFHSPLMEPMIARFVPVASAVRYAAPRIDLITNTTGASLGEEGITADHWCRHIRQPVQFATGMTALHQQGCEVFVEVGPKPVLLAMGRACVPEGAGVWLPSLRRDQEWDTLLRSLATLYEHGLRVDWAGFDRDYARRKVELPTYPFQRQRYWVPNASGVQAALPSVASSHPLLGQRLYLAESKERRYESRLTSETPAFLTDHRFFGQALLPAAAFLEMALAAGRGATFQQLAVREFAIHQPVVLTGHHVRRIQCTLSLLGTQEWSFQVHSSVMDEPATDAEPAWQSHASGSIGVDHSTPPPPTDLEALRSSFVQERSVSELYGYWRDLGIEYGPSFQAIERLWAGGGSALAKVYVPDALSDFTSYTVHPVLLDACLHMSLAALPDSASGVYVPVSIKHLRSYRLPSRTVWSHVSVKADDDAQQRWSANVRIFDEAGVVVAEVDDLTLRRTTRAALLSRLENPLVDDFYEVIWSPAPTINHHLTRRNAAHWLVLNDESDMGRQLAARFQNEGSQCTLVSKGDKYQHLDDYRRLLEALPDVTGVISLWSLDAPLDDFAAALEQVCGSTLHLVKALVSQPKPASLWLVTRGAIACPNGRGLGGSAIVPGIAQSPLWGLANVIALEHPELRCVRIDLDPTAVDIEALYTAILSDAREDQLAIRDHVRLTPRLIPARLRNVPGPMVLQPDATYLIVGGTRGLGLLVARWMASKGATDLVLMSRSGSVDPEAVASLERMGARVSVEKADVSDEDQTARVLARIDRPLRGVVHAAGVFDDGILQQQTIERFATVMAPKVQGAWHLHKLTQDRPLDFFVMFSSVASLLGSSGQANYSAANAFLDSLAPYRRRRGLPALTINWGGWSDVGEAAREEVRDRMRTTGLLPITPSHGLEALERLLSQSTLPGAPPQVAVTPIHWPTFLQRIPSGEIPPFLSQLDGKMGLRTPTVVTKPLAFREALEGTRGNDRLKHLSTHVCEQVAQVLGLPKTTPPSPDQGFFALGMDSLLALELRNRLQASLECTLPSTLTFNYPTIEAVVGYLAESLFAEPAARSVVEPPHPNSELDAMLAEIGQMSDGDVQQLLRRRS